MKLIPEKEAAVLTQLVSAGGRELFGLEMVRDSNGLLKLGTVYVTLGRLEEKGFVTSRKEDASVEPVPRRLYRVTGEGRRALAVYEASRNAALAVLGGGAT